MAELHIFGQPAEVKASLDPSRPELAVPLLAALHDGLQGTLQAIISTPPKEEGGIKITKMATQDFINTVSQMIAAVTFCGQVIRFGKLKEDQLENRIKFLQEGIKKINESHPVENNQMVEELFSYDKKAEEVHATELNSYRQKLGLPVDKPKPQIIL